MKRKIWGGIGCVIGLALLAGCNWELIGSDDEGVSNRHNAINFSGVYDIDPPIPLGSLESAEEPEARSVNTFTIEQYGNDITIVDNWGARYAGKLGSVRTTSGASLDSPTDDGQYPIGDTLIAQYNVSGTSKSGKAVTMTGVFQAVMGAQGVLNDRVILGTWVETRGKVADINGTAR